MQSQSNSNRGLEKRILKCKWKNQGQEKPRPSQRASQGEAELSRSQESRKPLAVRATDSIGQTDKQTQNTEPSHFI